MKAQIIRTDKTTELRTLNPIAAAKESLLDDVACVVSLTTSTSGKLTVYANGVAMQYDPVTCTIEGNADRPRRRDYPIS